SGPVFLDSRFLFKPNDSPPSWEAAGTLAQGRAGHSALLLTSGEVLVTGGLGAGSPAPVPLNSSELYSPGASPVWSSPSTLALVAARTEHTATLLPSGELLFVGGGDGTVSRSDEELKDPSA